MNPVIEKMLKEDREQTRREIRLEEARRVAERCLALDLSVTTIASVVELPIAEILKIRDSGGS